MLVNSARLPLSSLAGIEGVAILFRTKHSMHNSMRIRFGLHPSSPTMCIQIPFLHLTPYDELFRLDKA